MAYTTIDKPTDYFNTVLYTGTETSGKTVTGVGFQPDWIWIKNRADATNHNLYDSVRGGNGTSHYWLKSNSNVAEGTNTSSLLTIDSDGFTLGDGNEVNGSSDNIVSWNWLGANASSSNTDGSITSSVSANTTAGFSIVSYTGNATNSTVGHGLGTAPSMIIVKNRSIVENWEVYHQTLGNGTAIRLNLPDASFSTSGRWNNTSPTSSVFSLGTATVVNGSGNNLIAYCFAEKKGYSKFGSFTGNGSTDGTFVYTGFKPAWVMHKRTDSGADDSWVIADNKRDIDNPVQKYLFADQTNAEGSVNFVDFLSNGFKYRIADNTTNGNGNSYIYMAFAENPFVTSTGIPCTAR